MEVVKGLTRSVDVSTPRKCPVNKLTRSSPGTGLKGLSPVGSLQQD